MKSSGVVMVWAVRVAMPVRVSRARTSASRDRARIALPTAVVCGSTRRPTSVNMRMEFCDGMTCPT
jgi:hypothetical protein